MAFESSDPLVRFMVQVTATVMLARLARRSPKLPAVQKAGPRHKKAKREGATRKRDEILRDQHGYDGRCRSAGQREGFAKVLLDDPDA